MNEVAIRVSDVSKVYRLDHSVNKTTLSEQLAHTLRHPLSALRPKRDGNTEEFWALRDVGFEVNRGEVVGVIGRNGAGKSTLLKILSQITEPTTGEIEIYGRVASLLEVGTGFHPELSGRENIYLNGAILGMSRVEITSKFDEIVEFAEVHRFLDTPVKRYSSGMYVRLAFAVAAHLQPEILLVDEVLAVGDVEFQKKCIGRMEKVSHEGKTVLVVSHSMSTVKALCTRAILLEQGHVRAAGAVDDVVAQYLGTHRVDRAEKVITPADYIVDSGRLKVDRIRLVNGCGGNFSVYWKQPIQVQLDLTVHQPLEEVAFGAGIRAVDGTHVFHVHHDDGNTGPLWDFQPGQYTLDFSLENNLRPGMYKLHVGADQQHLMARSLFGMDAVTIEVLDHSATDEIPLASNTGLVNGYSSWLEPRPAHVLETNHVLPPSITVAAGV